jgi:hypothetical protein
MHITTPRVLGLLMFLALVGYAFFVGPWINTKSPAQSPASSVTAPKVAQSGTPTPSQKPVAAETSPAASDTPTQDPSASSDTSSAAPETSSEDPDTSPEAPLSQDE